MSTWVNDEEYKRIRESWRTSGRLPEKWTDEQQFNACHGNIREAAQREADLRALMATMQPGDPRLEGDEQTPPIHVEIRRAVCDQRHWSEYRAHYRARIEAKRRDPRQPREPGEDDA